MRIVDEYQIVQSKIATGDLCRENRFKKAGLIVT